MGKKPVQPLPPAPSSTSTFRQVERFWKARRGGRLQPALDHAFDVADVVWDAEGGEGVWVNRVNGEVVRCRRVSLREREEEDETGRGKGKARMRTEGRWAVLFPDSPGLVLLPTLLPPRLQHSLVQECLHSSALPNLTSLSAHYSIPSTSTHPGLWSLYASGSKGMTVPRKDAGRREDVLRRVRVDFEPVDEDNFARLKGRGVGAWNREGTGGGGEEDEEEEENRQVIVKDRETTVGELVKKLRWTNIGWNYDWTSKTYDFDQSPVPLPPLIDQCCREAVWKVPWSHVFPEDDNEGGKDAPLSVDDKKNWRTWAEGYNPEAGIINFYQSKDSLTAHVDQSEVDAVRPLVSFSIGHSAIFLVGGTTRETTPLSMILRSGDGLIMSGPKGRRVFHGLPRVLEDTLPSYLSSAAEGAPPDWKLFGEYLEMGARININVREVF
ncbi:hypothetical protein T439DRAFT_338281 [Meredithblackwellia eburnea MCA 4105]